MGGLFLPHQTFILTLYKGVDNMPIKKYHSPELAYQAQLRLAAEARARRLLFAKVDKLASLYPLDLDILQRLEYFKDLTASQHVMKLWVESLLAKAGMLVDIEEHKTKHAHMVRQERKLVREEVTIENVIGSKSLINIEQILASEPESERGLLLAIAQLQGNSPPGPLRGTWLEKMNALQAQLDKLKGESK